MDALVMIVGIAIIVLLLWLLFPSSSSQTYRCEKCGFETQSKLEAVGHEKLENAHKVVKSS